MGFIVVLILTTLAIAGSAAFFSIHGLAQIFTGSFWPVVIMASALESGKLVAASFLYRYWGHLGKTMKGYLFVAIGLLMVITSAGIFGFLSSAYQQSVLPLDLMQQEIQLLEQEQVELNGLKRERLNRRQQIDDDIASLPNNFVTGRQRLMESYSSERTQISTDVADYTNRIREITLHVQKLKSTSIQTQAEVGPIIFIAESIGREVNDATKWLILMIIFAFDPLAVALTIGANKALFEYKKQKEQQRQDDHTNDHEPHPTVTTIEQLIDDNTITTASITQIQQALDEFSTREKQLTPGEQEQRDMLSEMLRKRHVKQQVREGSSSHDPITSSVLDNINLS